MLDVPFDGSALLVAAARSKLDADRVRLVVETYFERAGFELVQAKSRSGERYQRVEGPWQRIDTDEGNEDVT